MTKITYKKVCTYKNRDIFLFRITNKSGAYCEMINLGATLISIVVPDKFNNYNNVILNYKNIPDYLADKFYLGATIGRVANRISNGKINIGQNIYSLDINDGKNSLHGGNSGFNTKIMSFMVGENKICFFSKSIDGEGGYPGNISFSIKYSFTDFNELIIEYYSKTDKLTPINMTNHAYFNLNRNCPNILSHELQVFCSEFLEMNEELLPTGNVLSTKQLGYDFREYSKLSDKISQKKDTLKGYNTFFIYKTKNKCKLNHLASLKEHTSGRIVELHSTMPGFLLYTGDFLNGHNKAFGGLCLETQYPPDFVNHPNFPQSIINPERNYNEQIKYVFKNE